MPRYCLPRIFSDLLVLISSNLIWHGHGSGYWKEDGNSFRARKYFSATNLTIQAQMRQGFDYCSHVEGAAAPTTLTLLDVQKKAINLQDDLNIVRNWAHLPHWWSVAELSQFYS